MVRLNSNQLCVFRNRCVRIKKILIEIVAQFRIRRKRHSLVHVHKEGFFDCSGNGNLIYLITFGPKYRKSVLTKRLSEILAKAIRSFSRRKLFLRYFFTCLRGVLWEFICSKTSL